jgi:hypothetical protein
MGNKQSDQGAKDFFYGLGGVLERGANAGVGLLTLPQQLMKSATDFVSSPMGSIMIPIMGIGALYVITQIKR